MFSRAQVRRAWERQGRTCNLCQRAIPFDLMHGDHIIAWSAGGSTTSGNLQALCGSCNLRKGAGSQEVITARFDPARLRPGTGELRKWQRQALPIVMNAIREEPVLVEACPGAGKTRFGLEIAFRLVETGTISRVLIIVPTVGIADGWRTAAGRSTRHTPTLPLHGLREWRAVDPIGDGWLGAITTYQSLFAAPDMYLAHATDPGHRTLVIFDEVHHASAAASWGEAAQFSFSQGAHAILSLSGTPFRTDRNAIVFVPSLNGVAKPHYRYSYDDAIRDGVCRPVQFVEVRGATTFGTPDGQLQTITFDDSDLTDAGERLRLRAALEWIDDRSIADKMLRDANNYLVSLRAQGDTDAAGLVVCVDCAHAARVTRHLEGKIIGRRPVMACSTMQDENDPAPANAIRGFINSHDPWLVAVNMVSEGIDVRRLRTVVYLTNRLTLLSFRQIVGRVVRTDPANVDDHGRVYIPADGRLIDMARKVTDDPDLLPPPIVIITDDERAIQLTLNDSAGTDVGDIELVETFGKQGQVFSTDGRGAGPELIECARRFIKIHGLTGTDPESLAIAASETPALRSELLAFKEA
ncbi:DEAD/DEAH box helicase family protein [Mycobacterium mantenii]|uniref:DEAD/DEAH box helicase family protein n=1 Tax=Mycobacterium mantenii TaxID=560555 RepID=UPI002416FE97|nr:DEAD/DEAH box helicase family protein [Mycobacterium mantenii]